ncbi:peroxiredoxin-like protein [Sinorhizobium medicae]|uniref:AMP-binding protein n=1 Tax=Sinorhizobium medicae TaxID=110321 RepID=UPI001199F3CC|nr:AMP-binding protein [Sinorhizobium medicae]TWA15291.1 peroxiredoxin-like protein [Sinorhizobium medicae]TWA35829.1 peroxiredoxin-like protein [Sinorhizobium medicae]
MNPNIKGIRWARTQLRDESDLGIGNFLWKALEVYPDDMRSIICDRPFETALGKMGPDLTLGDWGRLADSYARRYVSVGVGAGDPIAVYCDQGPTYLLHFLALTRLGAIPAFVNGRMDPGAAARYMNFVGAAGVFTDEARRVQLQRDTDIRFGFIAVDSDLRAEKQGSIEPHRHHPTDTCLITHSSGTTGIPKAVQLRHSDFFHPIGQSLETHRDPATRRAICALPASHNSAISGAAIAMMNGEELMLMSDLGGRAVLEAIELHRQTSIVAFPQTYVDLLASEPERYDLTSMALWINLGDAAHGRHIRRLTSFGRHWTGQAWADGSRFIDGLGSSEMGSMLFSMTHSPNTCTPRCIGKPRPWVEAVILDKDARILADETPGMLAVKSPGLFAGYWNNTLLTGRSHRNGYFLTGDVAYRDRLGDFHHLDRVSDAIMANDGVIYTLLYEEAIMDAVDAVTDCCVVAIEIGPGDFAITCLAVSAEGNRADLLGAEIDGALASRGLRSLTKLQIITPQEMPVGVTGKVLKAQLKQSLRAEFTGERSAGAGQNTAAAVAEVSDSNGTQAGQHSVLIRGVWHGGYSGTGLIEMGNMSCPVSTPAAAGGIVEGVSPSTMLVGAASGCYLLTLAAVLQGHRINAASIKLETDAVFCGPDAPQLQTIVHRPTVIVPSSEAMRLPAIHRCFELAKVNCVATKTMRNVSFEVKGTAAVETF